MKNISFRIEEDLLLKLHYVAKYEDRSANGEILSLVRKRIKEFEQEHGAIDIESVRSGKKRD